MSTNGNHDRVLELEREIDEQRQRVERRVEELQERLSPGQLLDQALRYTRHGGADFASSLGNAVTANPVPAVMLGVSLAWLMMGPKHPSPRQTELRRYPYATASSAGLQRIRHEKAEDGDWYSHFSDDAGNQYRARANEAGRRLGHFIDSSGRKFGGFIDETGHQIDKFRDEAGNVLDDAADWASHTFHDVSDAIAGAVHDVTDRASHMGGDVKRGAAGAQRTLAQFLEDQPLVAGALAFAAGATLGTALPPTAEEDELIGSNADKFKKSAGQMAADVYETGKKKAAELYEEGTEVVESAFEDTRQRLEGNGSPKAH